jgi:hypothetical protein
MVETIGMVLDRIETKQKLIDNVEVGPNDLSIDLLRKVYRANHLPLHTRMRAAISALKHEVPSLGISVVVSETDIAARLDRAIARANGTKLIEHRNENKETNGTKTEVEPAPAAPLRAPLARLYSARFRRM